MTSLLSMLDRFEQAAVTYETSTDKADRDELHAARRAIMEREEAAREFVKRHPALTLIDLAEFEAFLKLPAAYEALSRASQVQP